MPEKYSLLERESSEGRGDGTNIRVQVLWRNQFNLLILMMVIFSSLETPKITVEGEEKKDCEEGSSAHPLDAIQVCVWYRTYI